MYSRVYKGIQGVLQDKGGQKNIQSVLMLLSFPISGQYLVAYMRS